MRPSLGGAEVVQQRAPVGDRLAAAPAQLLDHVGHRLGQHDVAGGDREAVAQPPHLARGGVDRHRRGAPRARCRPRSRPPRRRRGRRAARVTREPSKIRTPRREQPLAQPERQPRGLDGRARARRHAGAEHRGVADRPRLGLRQRDHVLAVDGVRRWRRPARARRRRRGAAPRAATRRPPAPRRTRPPCRASPRTPRTARARGARRTARSMFARYSHSEERKPPLRPLGPVPQLRRPRASPRARSARARAPPTRSTCRCSRRRSPRRRRAAPPPAPAGPAAAARLADPPAVRVVDHQ